MPNMPRTIERAVEDITAAIVGALEVGLDPEATNLDMNQIAIALAEEI